MLKKTKSPALKIGGYIILGFFVLVIAISFGMPDFMSRMGYDPSVIATVNGDNIKRQDFLRYRDSNPHLRELASQGMTDMVLNYYLSDVLLRQTAESYGFDTTEKRLIKEVRSFMTSQMGIDSRNGIDRAHFKAMLSRLRISESEFTNIFREDIIRNDFLNSIQIGAAASSEDAADQLKLSGYEIQFRYAFTSNSDLRDRFSNRLRVTDEDIETEMAFITTEIKDPETDRKRIKQEIESRRLKEIKEELISQVKRITETGGSFNRSATAIGGNISISNLFTPGEEARDNSSGRPLSPVVSSELFRKEFFKLSPGLSSSVIETPSGLYVFTPVRAPSPASRENFSDEDIIAKKRQLEQQAAYTAIENLMAIKQERARIQKFLKTD